jgi:hypothetical protein
MPSTIELRALRVFSTFRSSMSDDRLAQMASFDILRDQMAYPLTCPDQLSCCVSVWPDYVGTSSTMAVA